MITISGKTFEHRGELVRMGAKFDRVSNAWSVSGLTQQQLDTVNTWVGVMIREVDDARVVVQRGKTGIYGDDQRYLNYFKDKDPTAFFGFSSLSAFIDYVDNLEIPPCQHGRDDGWITGDTTYCDWSGAPSLAHAVNTAREGWQGGLDGLVDLNMPHAAVKRRQPALAGGVVNVGRMLSGDPRHMVRRVKQPGRKICTLFVETIMWNGITVECSIVRAQLIAAIVDQMETSGYSCEIIAIASTLSGSGIGHQCAITVKQAGERLNLLDIVFALGHPAFLRRLIFAAVGASVHCRTTWISQGIPTPSFDKTYPTARNEYYIKQLFKNVDLTNPLTMLPLIKPDNLEL